MKYFKRTTLVSVINLALLGLPDAHADTASLERRIRELEARLEKLDQAGVLATKPAPVAIAPEVEKLSKKVNILERKLEVQDEVTTGNFQKLPVFEAGSDGFKITSQDKKHQVRIRGAVQTDARFFLDNDGRSALSPTPAGPDSLLVRQARVWLEGYFFKDLYFKIMPDFAAGNSNILPDAYLDYAYIPQASLLVGKFKPSISLERLQGDADTVFMERAFPANLAPNRDVGLQLHGSFGKPGYKTETVAGPIDATNAFTYQIGVTNGTGDSGSPNYSGAATGASAASGSTPALGSNDNKEIDGRIFAHPFQHTGYSWLEGFGLGVAGSFSSPNHQGINAQRTALGQSTFVDYSTQGSKSGVGGITSSGAASRIYPQAYWYAGPFGIMGEYVASTQHLTGSSLKANAANNNIAQTNTAFQIQGSYVVTGEDNTFGGVKPIRNFDPLKGSWGALQLATRWSELNVDNDTFKLLDPTKSASKATAWTLGANWFLNKNATIRLDYENVAFNGGAGTGAGTKASPYHIGNRPNEQVFATRFQLSF